MATPRVSAVVLAAGTSTRMGDPNKLLLDVDGMPMIRCVVEAVKNSGVAHVTVVVGHDAARVETALADLDVGFALNPHYMKGKMTSVRVGIAAAPTADGYIIALGDQPRITLASIAELGAFYARTDRTRVVVPLRDGVRGNPIVLPPRARGEIGMGEINFGCRNLIARYPDRVLPFASVDPAFFDDIDTPEAYAAFLSAQRPARASCSG